MDPTTTTPTTITHTEEDSPTSFLESFQQVWENPIGIAIIVLTMIVTFILFPPPPKSDDEEENNDDPTLQNKYLTYTTYQPKSTLLDDLKVLKVMWFTKIVGEELQDRLNNFYQNQASLYDAYRIRMLHGRPLLLKSVVRNFTPPNATTKKKGIVWVDLACGTGYNVENFRTCLDKCFHRIYLLDLCIPLCEVAQKERADKYNKSGDDDSKKKKIHVIHDDATNLDCKELPDAGTVDLVTISYSLVMIPNWKRAIENAKRLLKPNTGMIAICDFTVAPDQNTYMKKFWKKTFESDHVYLNEDHLKTLYQEFDVVDAYGSYGPLPYTPFFLQPAYYYFVGTNKEEIGVKIDA